MPDMSADDESFLLNLDRTGLEADTPEAAESYRRLMDLLQTQRVLNVTELHKALMAKYNLTNYDYFSSEYKKFTGQKRRDVLNFVRQNDLFKPLLKIVAQRMKAGLFAELADFIGIKSGTIDLAPRYLSGTYQVWRHSMSTPGAYVKGMLQVSERRPVLIAKMHQRYQPDDPLSEKHLKPRYEHLEGYALRQSGGRCFLVLSDKYRRQFRLSIFSGTAPISTEEDASGKFDLGPAIPIFSLTGLEFGTDDGKSFVSPVYVERVAETVRPKLDEGIQILRRSMNVYFPEDVPRKVLANLKMPITVF